MDHVSQHTGGGERERDCAKRAVIKAQEAEVVRDEGSEENTSPSARRRERSPPGKAGSRGGGAARPASSAVFLGG